MKVVAQINCFPIMGRKVHFRLHLRLQQQFAGRLPPLDIFGRALDVLQWVNIMDLDVQAVLLDETPQFLGILLEFFASGNVVEQCSAQELDVLRREAPASR